MADVELVIKIPKELYDLIQDKLDFNGDLKQKDIKTLMFSIDDGTPLPKGHGRLIDADDIDNHIVGSADTRDCPTIIEADKAGKRGADR